MSGYRFVGPKGFVGIPARDLTEAQFRGLPAMDRRRIRESTAYQAVAEPALADLKRDELNVKAAELGIEAPEKHKTKADLVAAIEAAQIAPPVVDQPDVTGDQEGAS